MSPFLARAGSDRILHLSPLTEPFIGQICGMEFIGKGSPSGGRDDSEVWLRDATSVLVRVLWHVPFALSVP
jgi:hypothetical protein